MWQKRGVTFWEDGLWLPRIEGIFCAMTFLLNVFFFFFDSSRRTGLTRHVTPNVLAIRILKDGVNLVTFFPQFEQLISAVVLWVCPAQLGSVFLLCFFFFLSPSFYFCRPENRLFAKYAVPCTCFSVRCLCICLHRGPFFFCIFNCGAPTFQMFSFQSVCAPRRGTVI